MMESTGRPMDGAGVAEKIKDTAIAMFDLGACIRKDTRVPTKAHDLF